MLADAKHFPPFLKHLSQEGQNPLLHQNVRHLTMIATSYYMQCGCFYMDNSDPMILVNHCPVQSG